MQLRSYFGRNDSFSKKTYANKPENYKPKLTYSVSL